jgi:hypothetical protein
MKINPSRTVLTSLAALALVIPSSSLLAGTNGFVVPTFRGSPNSEFGYWEKFTVPFGAPGNLPDQSGATSGAVLTQLNTNAFLTGSGNIYNLSTSSFALADSAAFTLGTVILQTRTIGTELDYASISLVYSNDSGEHVLPPPFHYELDRTAGQGVNVSSLWQWDLTGLDVVNYTIVFHAAGESLSFDSLTLDVANQFAPAFPKQPFALRSAAANIARWMYPFNASPANRPTASVFGSLGSTPNFDSRDAQYLLGWNTTNSIPAGHGAGSYVVRRARVTLTIASGNQYTYSGALRDYRAYFPTNDSRRLQSASPGSPVELYGAGYRDGYTAATFPQDGPWGVSSGVYYTNRTVYAAGFDNHGTLVDVSNNVGDDKTNEIAAPFEVAPFAVGQTTNVVEGQLMPLGSQLTFDLNLDDPLIYGYLQRGLNDGNLSFVATSLLGASFSGPPNYPNFYTSFSPIASADQYPLLEIEGEILHPDMNSDAEFKVLSLQYQTNTSELQFSFAPSRSYSIRWSDDLQIWHTATNAVLAYSSAWLSKTPTNVAYPAPVYGIWRDVNSTNSQRFYRVGAL